MSERTPSGSGDAVDRSPTEDRMTGRGGDALDGEAAGNPSGPGRHGLADAGREPTEPLGMVSGETVPGGEPAAEGEPVADGGDDGRSYSERVRNWREVSRKRNARNTHDKAKRPFWIELPILIVIAFILTFLIQTFIARVYYVPSGSMEQTLHGTTSGGDRILAFKLIYDFGDPAQGDVVVFKGPDTWAPEADIPGPSNWFAKAGQAIGSVVGIAPPNEKDFVKRVIAVGGQTVSCCDAQGRVQVDGVPLDEPYIYQPIDEQLWAQPGFHCEVDPANPARYNSRRCFAPFAVPTGQLWVMGDHRSDSSDSSYYCQGLTEQGMKQYEQSSTTHATCGRPIPADDVIGKAVFIVMPPSRWGTIGSPDIMSASAAVPGVAGTSIGRSGTLPAIAPAAVGLLGATWIRRVRRPRGPRREHRSGRRSR